MGSIKIFILLFLSLSFSACVSIDMQPETQSAEDLNFKSPGGSFKERDAENLDAYFVDDKTGNSISLKSSCYDPADPSIENLEMAAFGGMTIVKEISKTQVQYSGREALDTKKLVKIDGVPVIVEMRIFKKNNCNYLIGHVGVEKNFDKTAKNFSQFLNNLRTP